MKKEEQEKIVDSQTSNRYENFRIEEQARDSQALRQARKNLQYFLLILLSFEIISIVYLMISQGIKCLLFTKIPFQLSEWSFIPFVNVALIQTFFLIRPIANNLFPSSKPPGKQDV